MNEYDDTGLLKAVEIDTEALITLLSEIIRRGGCGVLPETGVAREALFNWLDATSSKEPATDAGS